MAATPPPKRRGLLGCSFPIVLGLGLTVLVLFIVGLVTGGIGTKVLHLNLPSWLTVTEPAVELPAGVVFHVASFPVTNTIIATWITMVFLILFCWLVTRHLREVPRRWQMVLEYGLGAIMGFCERVAGEKNGRQFFPIVMTIFLFVAFNAWLALLPFFGGAFHATLSSGTEVELIRAANTDLNTPLALALVSFVAVAYFGLRLTGRKYFKQFFNFGKLGGGFKAIFRGNLKGAFGGIFTGVIDVFIGFIELLSMFIRILSFTFRLFGNMTAGEILLLMVTFLAPFVVALPFYGLEMLVGLVQALIFAILTLVFITLAVASHGEEH